MGVVPAGPADQTQSGPVYFKPQRNIGGIVMDVTIEEVGTDDNVITEHPVEQGAPISDHAYNKPVRLVIRAGASNSSAAADGDPFYAQEVYDKLLSLKQSLGLFNIVTGKRSYSNMLFESLVQTTDQTSEYALAITANFRELILVQTEATAVPPVAQQAQPQSTNPPSDQGNRQLTPAPNANQGAIASALPAGTVV